MVTIGFCGDVMLGRLVNETIDRTAFDYPWGNMLSLLQQNDVNVINLETTLTHSNNIIPKVFNFKATPDKVQSLILANITVCNLANNHILDFSIEGMQETIKTLDQAGIAHVGAGNNITQAAQPTIIEHNNIRIGIIGYTDNEPTWHATDVKPGTNYVHVGDINTVQQQVNALKGSVDIIIASIHWGPNMRDHPTQEFIDFAHAMIDAGINIIHGHSAHVFQAIELYNNGIIMYDTGDFVDDYAVDAQLRNDHSFLFIIHLDKDGIQKLRLVPTLISNMQVNQAVGSQKEWCIRRMQELCAPFGTIINKNGNVQLI